MYNFHKNLEKSLFENNYWKVGKKEDSMNLKISQLRLPSLTSGKKQKKDRDLLDYINVPTYA